MNNIVHFNIGFTHYHKECNQFTGSNTTDNAEKFVEKSTIGLHLADVIDENSNDRLVSKLLVSDLRRTDIFLSHIEHFADPIRSRQSDDGLAEAQIFPDVKESPAKFKQKYELAVLSNGTPKTLRDVLKANGLDDLIDPSNEISVGEVRVVKTHPTVYVLTRKKLRLSKSEIVFVSGNSWDVSGAKSYGLPSVWVNQNDEPEPNLGASADMEFSDLNQLAKRFHCCDK